MSLDDQRLTLGAFKCTNYSPTQVDMLRADDIAISGSNGVEAAQALVAVE